MKGYKGFTLIEVIVIMAVIAILAAMAIPTALRIFQATAENTTRDEMDNLKKAILGDARKLQSHFRSDFGFLGDIGKIPANLDELLTRGSLPAFTFDSSKQAGAGWKGPYITGAAAGQASEDFKKDQWGNSYTYSDADFTNADGQLADGKITSAGPDGVLGTADDIVLEILKNETVAGFVRGTVKDGSGTGMAGASVEFYSAVNGALTTTTTTTDALGNYSFASAPYGPRSVKAIVTGLYLVAGSVSTSGGGDNDTVNFDVANYAGSDVIVTHITVTCNAPAVRYDDVTIGGVSVESTSNISCGTKLDITDTTIPASSTLAPMRVFVDSPDTQLADLTVKGGTVRRISLITFEESDGTDFNMANHSLTVTFWNGTTVISTITFTTP